MRATRGDLPASALVVGAVRSGVAAALALAGRGARVRLHDGDASLRPDVPPAVELALGAVEPTALLRDVEVLVKSPGVPVEAPVVQAALAAGVPVWAEVELGYRLLPPGARVIGITGTNGKTTTTELAGAMVAAAGLRAVVAGNVGTALSGIAEGVADDAVVVCELSSFQLEDVVSLRCAAATLLNVTPDHLDRHGTLDAYRAAKLRVFERQEPDDVAVLNGDDPAVRALGALPGHGRVVRVGAADADALGFATSRLRGDHNRQNVACAAALARAVGVGDDAIRAAVAVFAPVPNRLEPCGSTAGGVSFWNDSKATNVDATLKALTAFPPGTLRIVLGGSDKGLALDALATALAGHVRRAYLTGPAGRRMAPVLAEAGVDHVLADGFDDAVRRAAADAEAGDAVLLAPACASFDEFRSYEHRGARFRELARELGAA